MFSPFYEFSTFNPRFCDRLIRHCSLLSKSHAKTLASMCQCSPGFRPLLVPSLLLIMWTSRPSPPSTDILRKANAPIVFSLSLVFLVGEGGLPSPPLSICPSPGLDSVPLREFEIVRSLRQVYRNRKDRIPKLG